MSASFVVDCSVAMAWCFPDEATAATGQLLDRMAEETAAIPGLWYLEVTNVLALAERKKRIRPAKVAEFIALVESFEFEVDEQTNTRAFAHLLPLCRSHGTTANDAAYLDVALRHRLPLASLDDNLREAAKKLGVDVLGR
jgi:predicted nucleic acid-binding protein